MRQNFQVFHPNDRALIQLIQLPSAIFFNTNIRDAVVNQTYCLTDMRQIRQAKFKFSDGHTTDRLNLVFKFFLKSFDLFVPDKSWLWT